MNFHLQRLINDPEINNFRLKVDLFRCFQNLFWIISKTNVVFGVLLGVSGSFLGLRGHVLVLVLISAPKVDHMMSKIERLFG